MKTKVCVRCGKEKSLAEFYHHKTSRDGYRTDCKSCKDAANKKYIREHSEYYHSRIRRAWLSKYGLTVEQYDVLLESQNGVCAICGKPETHILHGKLCRLAVDHDHRTGRIRGLLCVRCNNVLGHSGDNPEILKRAIAYIKRQET